MTATQIRQSFLDFFREKQHTIVPSSSLLPDSPNLLFTNAGMNQFVPIFLGQTPCPYQPGRAADTQKCIRAGGKHNDLEDVGLDTYHHTLFEMLGNWSFGDYFKKEAIHWAWELIVGRWGFPPSRLYATVYKPGPGDPSEFDQEAWNYWANIFRTAGLDPAVHIVNGNKKDNFWMMGETGPCGPCSELHVDLTPEGDTRGSLVNAGDARCIEIWNLVFIQFNANPDGSFVPLPARHVDTGMGFERVASIIQGTKNFSDFKHAKISNYETDIFRPIFDEIEKLSGKRYASTLPQAGSTGDTEQERLDVAFRVIADHIRTLSFSIADGILPGNAGRNYVLRRILRRAVKYGRTLGFEKPFFHQLARVVAKYFGEVFPELRTNLVQVEKTIQKEEESFNRTLDNGLVLFEAEARKLKSPADGKPIIPGSFAFRLYDEQGFPLDLTQLLARERGLDVDVAGFEKLMEEQRERARASQEREVITVESSDGVMTQFLGFDSLETEAHVLQTGEGFVVLDQTPFYAEMGGQLGDVGHLEFNGNSIPVLDTKKSAGMFVHRVADSSSLTVGSNVRAKVEQTRRARIEAHHSVTHLVHWALRLVLGNTVTQKGSYVGPDGLRFDFSHLEGMTPDQIAEVERLVNEKIKANDAVVWNERPYAEVKGDPSILQFFGDKYGVFVRVVEIGGYSRELCGGTHVRHTGQIGYFKLLSESAIAAGVRRIEAASGAALIDHVNASVVKQNERYALLKKRYASLAPLPEITSGLDAQENWTQFATRQTQLEVLDGEVREWEKAEAKKAEALLQSQGVSQAEVLLAEAKNINGTPAILANLGDLPPGILPHLADALKSRWKGVAVLATTSGERVALLASVSADYVKKVSAGKIIQAIAPVVGGKGGGRPELAQGGGTDVSKISEALEKAKSFL